MTTTLDSLQDLLRGPVTGEEGRSFVRDLVATAPQPIPVQVLDTPGTSEAAIVWALGEGEAVRSADRLAFAKAGFRSLAPIEWLRLIALELYGVAPRQADFATTTLSVTNLSGALHGPFDPGELRFVNDSVDPPAVYSNESVISLPVGPSTTAVPVRALEAGSASTAAIGEIDALESPLEGVTVTNEQPAIGQDDEDADSLNTRIDARLGIIGVGTFSTGGPATAIESIARNGLDGKGVPRADGSRITVSRTKVILDILTGTSTLWVADEDGPLADGDLVLVREAVQSYAEWLGSLVNVENSNPVGQQVSCVLTVTGTSATDDEILAEIDSMLLRATQTTPIGGYSLSLSVRYVENIVESAGDAGKQTAFTLVDVTMTQPSEPVPLAVDDVVIFARNTVTIVRV